MDFVLQCVIVLLLLEPFDLCTLEGYQWGLIVLHLIWSKYFHRNNTIEM
jgi:hypothetical protein